MNASAAPVIAHSRNATIDVAKGIGILLVVLGHNFWVVDQVALKTVVYSFHVPLFIFLAGVFFRPDRPLALTVARRADALLKPYFITLVALAAFQVLFRGRDGAELGGGILYGTGATIAWIPLWFLPYLFLLTVGAWLYWRIAGLRRDGAVRRVAALAVLLVGGVWAMTKIAASSAILFGQPIATAGLPWSLGLLPIGGFYFLLGYYCQAYLLRIRWHTVGAVLALLAFVALFVFTGDTMDLNQGRYDSLAGSTAAALLGIYLALQLAAALQQCKPVARALRYVGESSLLLLLLHGIVQAIAFTKVREDLVGGAIPHAALAYVVGVGVPLLVGEGLKRLPLLEALLLPRRLS